MHLLWALDCPPGDVPMSPTHVASVFAPAFELRDERASRRRLASSHWYWLVRAGANPWSRRAFV